MNLLLKILLQTCLAFFTILFITKLLGKQQISQLTYYEYITGITFGSIAATMATDTDQLMWQHLIGLVFFGLLTFSMSIISLKNRPLRKIIAGEPVIVVQDGQILENNLKKMHYNIDEFTSELRAKDIFDINDLEYAIIETSGKISILKKANKDTPTREDLNIAYDSEGLPVEIIIDGQLIYSNLERMGLDGKWLKKQLNKQDILSLNKVALASVDKNHNLYIDLYEDDIKGMIDVSDDPKIPFTMDTINIGEKDEK
ncbi:MAG: membrane protein [Clostridiaceae bacterium BRH_c20a]|nr:MAG: membrane protein [Clostridiaceae bacterium BRH_c20a]